jgi:hypothetical protein
MSDVVMRTERLSKLYKSVALCTLNTDKSRGL